MEICYMLATDDHLYSKSPANPLCRQQVNSKSACNVVCELLLLLLMMMIHVRNSDARINAATGFHLPMCSDMMSFNQRTASSGIHVFKS
jgi:hypothetical protein